MTTPTTYTDLCAQAEAAMEGTTEGPWADAMGQLVLPPEGPAVAMLGPHSPLSEREANARFIAWARNNVPALIAAIRELEKERDVARVEWQRCLDRANENYATVATLTEKVEAMRGALEKLGREPQEGELMVPFIRRNVAIARAALTTENQTNG